MLKSSVLNDTLKDFNYYFRKLPMFLQQSAGFSEHFRIWYDILVGTKNEVNNTGVVGVGDTIFNLLNIFDQEVTDYGIRNLYLEYLITIDDAWEENASEQEKLDKPFGTRSDILDKIGSLFGVTRSFDITYIKSGEEITSHLQLDNNDFLILIKAQIVKNYCEGTYEQITQYYESVGLRVLALTSSEGATSNLYLIRVSGEAYDVSEDVEAMFLAGLLTIKSMGIAYRHVISSIDEILIWDKDTSQYGWGEDVENQGQTITNGGKWIV